MKKYKIAVLDDDQNVALESRRLVTVSNIRKWLDTH